MRLNRCGRSSSRRLEAAKTKMKRGQQWTKSLGKWERSLHLEMQCQVWRILLRVHYTSCHSAVMEPWGEQKLAARCQRLYDAQRWMWRLPCRLWQEKVCVEASLHLHARLRCGVWAQTGSWSHTCKQVSLIACYRSKSAIPSPWWWQTSLDIILL